MQGNTLISGVVITVIAGGLFASDYLLKEQPYAASLMEGVPSAMSSSAMSESSSSSLPGNNEPLGLSSSSSSHAVVKKGVSTKKQAGINVQSVLDGLQLVTQETNESGFLTFIPTGGAVVQTWVLLRNNDRAFLFSWVDSGDAKTMFSSLKQALSEQFSARMTDLVDETRTQENGPPVDVLSFSDPTLSPEKIMFLRVRTRLYEIHIAANGAEVLDRLVKELSK